MKIIAIILTVDQRERTLQCLDSLTKRNKPTFSVLVWDNGSQDGTIEAIQAAFPDVNVHRHTSNLGVASGRNAAAELAIKVFTPTHLLFLDNDMTFEDNFVNALGEPFLQDPKIGQTQAKLLLQEDRSRLNDGGGIYINFFTGKITPIGYGEIDRGQYDFTRKCIAIGGAMMVRTDVFQQLHGFDATFDPFGPEDLDFSLRLQKTGYSALFVPQAVAYHAVSHTFGKGYSEEYARSKIRHWHIFVRRHASPLQQLGFFLIGGPYRMILAILRESRNSNKGGVRGLVQGLLDLSWFTYPTSLR